MTTVTARPSATVASTARRKPQEQVRSFYPSLSASMRRVADRVMAAPEDITPMSAARLAAATDTSVGTVVRFCHALGFPGYLDFKDALRAETERPTDVETVAMREPEGTVDTVLTTTLLSMARSVEAIDPGAIHEAAAILREARRILIPSAGPSQPLAMALAQMLQIAGHAVSHPVDVHTQVAIAETLDGQDVCFPISHSGTTAQTLEAAETARRAGARLVGLTSFARSPLAEMVDLALVAGAPADGYRSSDRASRPLHLAVLQSVFAVLEHGPR